MEIKVGYGTINRFDDTASGSWGDKRVSTNFGLSICVENNLSKAENDIIHDKINKWFEEKILNNPKLIESIRKQIDVK